MKAFADEQIEDLLQADVREKARGTYRAREPGDIGG
jgi:hypothetical protein